MGNRLRRPRHEKANDLAIAGSALAFGGAAVAGEGGDKEAKMAEKFAKIDANGDGAVSEDEYMAHKRAYYARRARKCPTRKRRK